MARLWKIQNGSLRCPIRPRSRRPTFRVGWGASCGSGSGSSRSPKLYFVDTGLLCSLLDLTSSADLARHPQRGAIFENWVVVELSKAILHRGGSPSLWFWRDLAGKEVDVLLRHGNRVLPIEVKSGATVQPRFFEALDAWRALYDEAGGWVVYAGDAPQSRGPVRVVPWHAVHETLAAEGLLPPDPLPPP